jgi:hypothetical protein
MSFKHSIAFVSSIIALSTSACATRQALPLSPANRVTCPGGSIHGAAEAARYSACNIVQGDLTVTAGDLTDLAALSQLRHVTGTLRISDSPALDDLSGLENLSRVGALEIQRDAELDDLAGLEALHSAGRVEVTDNAELRTLDGLQGLSATGRLLLRNNGLYSARGLSELREVGELVVLDNRELNSLTSLGSLRRARSVEIRNNPVLCGAGLLTRLERVEAPLVLQANRGISHGEAQALLERSGELSSRLSPFPIAVNP